jgi:hypothetical protein
MKSLLSTWSFSFGFSFRSCAFPVLMAVSSGLVAQPSPSGTETQHEAMRKLAFLVGRWSGPATIVRGPSESLHLTQTENVEYKLDGLVLLIEGKAVGADGRTQFEALATVAYDDASHAYRFRAYHDGHYVDTELKTVPDGFSWAMDSGPAHIVNTMQLTAKGEWQEATEVAFGGNPPRRSVEMMLEHEH